MRSLLTSVLILLSSTVKCQEPNPPNWNTDKVKILDPDQGDQNQQTVDAIFKEMGGYTLDESSIGQFSSDRYAIMFKPGHHTTKVNVGYYTQILGLGESPTQTTLGNLTVMNGGRSHTLGALCNFWRGAENVQVNENINWAVSQAVSLRRLQVNGNVDLFALADDNEVGYASGGFMADTKITGVLNSGPQQQWMTRNSDLGSFTGSNWNLVFAGTMGAPVTHCSNSGGSPYTTLWKTDRIAEKPYITMDANGGFNLNVPKLEQDKQGLTPNEWKNADQVGFDKVYTATDNDTAAVINAKIDAGLHIVFQPGIYNLTDTIKVTKDNTVLLGIGLATLISGNGQTIIEVGDVQNVRVAGLLLQAGPKTTPVLLRWGITKNNGTELAPGVMSDIYARVGGPEDQKVSPTSCSVMVEINHAHVIIDNTWLWRADHDVSGNVYNLANPSDTGLIVNGDDVTAYGLMSEHHLKNLVEWNGDNGKTVMYQSEFPYDATQDYADGGYSAYHVNDTVNNHKAYGIGAYAFLRDNPVIVKNGIYAPDKDGMRFINSLTVFLWGNDGSGIDTVISGKGLSVGMHIDHVTWVCVWDPDMYYGEGSVHPHTLDEQTYSSFSNKYWTEGHQPYYVVPQKKADGTVNFLQ